MAHLFIVARTQPDLYAYLSRAFAAESDVRVILDRRYHERRQIDDRPPPQRDRRRSSRRHRAEITTQLNTLGYAFVRLDPEDAPRRVALL